MFHSNCSNVSDKGRQFILFYTNTEQHKDLHDIIIFSASSVYERCIETRAKFLRKQFKFWDLRSSDVLLGVSGQRIGPILTGQESGRTPKDRRFHQHHGASLKSNLNSVNGEYQFCGFLECDIMWTRIAVSHKSPASNFRV